MGGIGSDKRKAKPCLESFPSFILRPLVKAGCMVSHGHVEGAIQWFIDHQQHMLYFTVDWRIIEEPLLILQPNAGPHKYEISLEHSPQPFGGMRWWMRCPRSGVRCNKMFFVNGDFMSGRTLESPYHSQQITERDRYVNRAHKLLWQHGIDGPFGAKPAGMHQKTYDRLMDEAWEFTNNACNTAPASLLNRLNNALSATQK